MNLINNFKERLNDFPNNGRISNNVVIFLSALKAEDKLDELNKLLEIQKFEYKKISEKQLVLLMN